MLDVRKPSFDEVCDGSDGGSAAVGGEDRAGGVAGLGGGEEDDHAGDLIGLGGAGHEGGRAHGFSHAVGPDGGVDRSGDDGVDPHAGGGELGGPGGGQR